MNYAIKTVLLFAIFGSAISLADDAAVTMATASESGAISIAEAAPVVISQPSDITTPPEWLANAMYTIEKLPIVGPIAVEVFKWLGVISAIMTALVTCLLSISRTLFYAAKFGSVASLMAWVTKFETSKIMNWLKFFSIYNAKKE